MKFTVSGLITVSCWTEVEAESAKEAITIAARRGVAEPHIDAGYPLDEYWHIDTDGEPGDFTAEPQ